MIRFWSKKSRRAQPQVALAGRHRWWATALLFLVLAGAATAQEALRYSLSGQDMAEARKRQLENEKFSVKWGPVGLRFSANLGIEATDNVTYTNRDPQADLIITPQLNTFARWRATENNVLTASVGLGYAKYVNTTEYDRFQITPNTALSFDIYAGDFLINLHDNFYYSADVSSDPTVSGTGSIPGFQNTLGIRAVWDMNPFVIASYDHQNFIAGESRYDYLTRTAELFTANIGYQSRSELSYGLELAGGLTDYMLPRSQDNQHVSLGVFVKVRLSEYTSFRINAGYVMYFVDPIVLENGTSLPNATSNFDAIYTDVSFSQRVGNVLSHTLTFGRSLQPGQGEQSFGSQLVEIWRIYHYANWNILRKTGVSTSLSYEKGSPGGELGESFDRYGAGITFSRQLAKNTTGSIGYQFYLKNSNRPGYDYLQNRLVLSLTYAF